MRLRSPSSRWKVTRHFAGSLQRWVVSHDEKVQSINCGNVAGVEAALRSVLPGGKRDLAADSQIVFRQQRKAR